MLEKQSESGEQSFVAELDAYLDRELFVQLDLEVKPMPGTEKPAERLQSVLALAAEEEQWLRTLPPPELPAENSMDLERKAVPVPEHLRPVLEVEPPPPVQPVLAVMPPVAQPRWSGPAVPVPPVPGPTPWIAMGALVGVSAASLLAAGMLWMERDSRVLAAEVPAGIASAVQPPSSAPAPEEPAGALPGPVFAGRMSAPNEPPAPAPATSPEPRPESILGTLALATGARVPSMGHNPEPTGARAKAEPLKPREEAQARRAPAVKERSDVEDPFLESMDGEPPFMQPPAVVRNPAPAAKAAPKPADSEAPGEYEEFDKDFARELGFTKDAVRKVPEPRGVKTVWIPPDPDEGLLERLTPEDIQRVVVTHQPAITSCLRRHKEGTPGVRGGKFVMRWSIYPSGSTYGVAMETQALRGTDLATCIEGLVKDWKFPRHRTQMGPIRFPFIF